MAAPVRLAELMAALSVATDYAMGQPVDYALSATELALRLGELAGYTDAQLRDTYYQSLLRFVGCNAETYTLAAIVGDEIAMRTEVAAIDTSDQGRMLGLVLRFIRQANPGTTPLALLGAITRGLMSLGALDTEFFPGHCEVAQRLGERLGFSAGFVTGLGQLYARWDGKGIPRIAGEAITPAVRLVMLAQDMTTFVRVGGVTAAVAVARQRRARQYDPRLVDLFVASAHSLTDALDARQRWSLLLAREPGGPTLLDAAALDRAIEVLADFADIKSPWMLTHSRRVAQLAGDAAQRLRLAPADQDRLRRAGLLHDLGRVGVSAGIWGRPGPLSEGEREKVRLHAYYTERVLARGESLAALGALASAAHERADGSGYFRGRGASADEPLAGLLAAADVYAALVDDRPHRPAYTSSAAARILGDEARAGRLDVTAVSTVLECAGHRAPALSSTSPALPVFALALSSPAPGHALTSREIDVLRTLARGNTNKQIARLHGVSPKTIDNQIQSIYAKAGVRTRAGATLYAMERRLL